MYDPKGHFNQKDELCTINMIKQYSWIGSALLDLSDCQHIIEYYEDPERSQKSLFDFNSHFFLNKSVIKGVD